MKEIKIDMENQSLIFTLVDDCDVDLFYKFVEVAENKLGICFGDKFDNFDSLYYIFKYGNVEFVLSYHIYHGIKLFTTDKEKENITKSLIKLISQNDY